MSVADPKLVELAKEWRSLWDAGNAMPGDILNEHSEHQSQLRQAIKDFPVRSIADLAVKAAVIEVMYEGSAALELCADIKRLATGTGGDA